MKVETCYVDMDGIITDLQPAVFGLYGLPNAYDDRNNHGVLDLFTLLPFPEKEFWAAATFDFWYGLKHTHDCIDIMTPIVAKFGIKNVGILSYPAKDSVDCGKAKQAWIDSHLAAFSNQLILARNKYLMAAPNKLLIDDFDKNVQEFIAAGGKAFLYPRPWNSAYKQIDHALELLVDFLEQI